MEQKEIVKRLRRIVEGSNTYRYEFKDDLRDLIEDIENGEK